ncbi:MAG: hypothetical protein RJA37_1108 [Verrucomicrobiota bacterium]
MPEAAVRVLLVRRNHPFSDGSELVSGVTDERGRWDFKPGAMHVSRVHVDKVGHHIARMEGLAVPQTPTREVILPRKGEAVPLHCRRAEESLPGHVLSGVVAYDLERGDLVAPGHRGVTPDLLLRIDAKPVGWAGGKSASDVQALLAKEKDPKERKVLLLSHGRWDASMEMTFPADGDGILEHAYAPYAWMRLPSTAPASGYAGKSVFTGQDGADRKRGFFLRVRTVKDAAGNIVSANYAKLYGEPLAGPGGFTFQYYYNPNPNDRRLEMDLQRNLQKPVPADDWEEKFNTRATYP